MHPIDVDELQQTLAHAQRMVDELMRSPVPTHPQNPSERQQAARDEAQASGQELITPLAACKLFKKSAATVRRAVNHGHVWAPYVLQATGTPTNLIDLKSAIHYWNHADPDTIHIMRNNGNTLTINGNSYNILSLERLIDHRDLHRKDHQ